MWGISKSNNLLKIQSVLFIRHVSSNYCKWPTEALYTATLQTHGLSNRSGFLNLNPHTQKLFYPTFDKLVSMIHCLTKVLSFARTTILYKKLYRNQSKLETIIIMYMCGLWNCFMGLVWHTSELHVTWKFISAQNIFVSHYRCLYIPRTEWVIN